jgi:hypothetical protein
MQATIESMTAGLSVAAWQVDLYVGNRERRKGGKRAAHQSIYPWLPCDAESTEALVQ